MPSTRPSPTVFDGSLPAKESSVFRLFIAIVAGSALSAPLHAQAPLESASSALVPSKLVPLALAPLIEEALANNPGLEILRHRLKAVEAALPVAGTFDDPQVKFELSNVPLKSFDFSSTPMSGKQLTLSQKLPYPGKLASRRRLVKHQIDAGVATYSDGRSAIVHRVKQAYFSLSFLDRSLEITQRNGDLLRDLARIAKSRYAVGEGLQLDVLKAHVAQSDLQNRLIDLRSKRLRAAAQLNTVLARPPQTPVGPVGLLPPTPLMATLNQLQDSLTAHRPQLQAIKARARQWSAAEQLARLDGRPDFTLNLGYRQRDFIAADPVAGSDFVSLGVAFNLPVHRNSRQEQQALQARLNRLAAESEYDNQRQQLLLQLQLLFVDAEANRQQAELIQRQIIPQAEQALKAALSSYQVGKVDFLTLLDSQITLLDHQIQYCRHLTAYETALAGIEAVVGQRLF
jgi:outer membrane protein, heavy metal efflux system